VNLHEWITDVVEARTRFAQKAAQEPLHDPSLVADTLRRCEADRRVLARHRLDTRITVLPHATDWATACAGCGGYEYSEGPETENLNDCPELLDLAYALGITDEDLAGLDRPEPPPVIPPVKRTRARMNAEQAPATFHL
jgi:hypothetical protein